jgi:hypothetical protein
LLWMFAYNDWLGTPPRTSSQSPSPLNMIVDSGVQLSMIANALQTNLPAITMQLVHITGNIYIETLNAYGLRFLCVCETRVIIMYVTVFFLFAYCCVHIEQLSRLVVLANNNYQPSTSSSLVTKSVVDAVQRLSSKTRKVVDLESDEDVFVDDDGDADADDDDVDDDDVIDQNNENMGPSSSYSSSSSSVVSSKSILFKDVAITPSNNTLSQEAADRSVKVKVNRKLKNKKQKVKA